SPFFTGRHVRRYECCSRQPDSKTMSSGVSHSQAGGTSQGRAGLGLWDLATDEVFTDEVLAGGSASSGGVAISGGGQLSAVRAVLRALKNVFGPMLLGPADARASLARTNLCLQSKNSALTLGAVGWPLAQLEDSVAAGAAPRAETPAFLLFLEDDELL